MLKKFFYFFFLTFFFAQPALAQTPNDPYITEQWYLDQIDAYSAWDTATGSNEVVVAVLDTGVDVDHEDLVDNLWENSDEVPDDGIDNDHNGYVDDVNGWDFVRRDATTGPEYAGGAFDVDAVSHGTFVSGIIGAVGNNNKGITGINWQVKIMPVRILDRFGSGDTTFAANGVRYAVANGADVINFSLTGPSFDSEFLAAVKEAHEAGVVMVAALGNEGENINNSPVYPACFMSDDDLEDYVIGVVASDEEDLHASFSNYGSDCADISAPGVSIFSTLLQEDDSLDFSEAYGGGWDGTSVAAPMVSGAAAFLKGVFPGITPNEIKLVLQLSVDPLKEKGTEAVGQIGAGRLNLSKALALAPSFASVVEETVERAPSGWLAVGLAGGSSMVRTVDSAGNKKSEFYAYAENFSGGVRLAMGDIDGDGVDEIVTGAGPGGGPQVRVFETDGTFINQFFAYNSNLTHGIFVGVGDLDSDGVAEILTSPDAGGNGEVRWFNLQGEQNGFIKPVGASAISLRVAAGDINNDGSDEIIVGSGSGSNPMVWLFDGGGTFISSFEAYAATYNKGIYVEAGDLDGDGSDEIVTGTDYGGGPHVRVFKADGSVVSSFFAYDPNFRGGVRVAVADLDNNGTSEIYTAAGPGGGPHLRVFNTSGTVIGGFFPFEESAENGIFVAGW